MLEPSFQNGMPRCVSSDSNEFGWFQCERKFMHKGRHRFTVKWDNENDPRSTAKQEMERRNASEETNPASKKDHSVKQRY